MSQGTRLTVFQVSLADEGTYTCKKFYNQDVTRMFAVEVTGKKLLFYLVSFSFQLDCLS